ncbi:hypothetical protein AB0E77_08780 [Streptomyces sp. NPDC032940]|uniref:hypothetical protein n=1 Tax=Streptomyces sp. NPDC032940 TaxID=3155366 RepID=UPI0033CC04D3
MLGASQVGLTDDPLSQQALAELVRLQRVLTVRSAVYWEFRTHLFAERVRGPFDEGVRLARRLHQHDAAAGRRALATALTDRATFHAAAKEFGAALDDFRQVPALVGDPQGD